MRKLFVFGIVSFLALSSGCNKSSNTSTTSDGAEASSNTIESALIESTQQATATEGASSVSSSEILSGAVEYQGMDFLDPQDGNVVESASASCRFSSARSVCSSNVSTISWDSCVIGSANLTGGWTETWSTGFCADGSRPLALTNGNSVTRTATSQVLTLASGATITTSTSAHTAYDGTSISGAGVQVSMSGGTRTTAISGMRKIMYGPYGRKWFDHSLTSSGLSTTGTRATQNRIVSGNIKVYHNLSEYTAVNTFDAVTWSSATCCYPTSGTITSVLSGSVSGTATLVFSSTCGSATFTSTSGSTETVTLTQCN